MRAIMDVSENRNMESSGNGDQNLTDSGGKRGGWITLPFILGSMAGLTLAGGGWQANLIVYLIKKFNMKSIDAAQISNVVNGCTNLFPVVAAIIADSFLGSFSVILISSVVSLLGVVLLCLTTSLNYLRPQPCEIGSSWCKTPSKLQFAVLYAGMTLATLGMGGIRFTVGTMGANQFDKPEDQGTFFNWYFFCMYISMVISGTAIVYIEDNVSWKWGFGISVAANVISLVTFLLGSHFYRRDKQQGSPFTGLARVVVATVRKRKIPLSSKIEDYHYENDGKSKVMAANPKRSFRFLNRAALKTEEDIMQDGTIAKSWRLCTIQQVEDLKTIIRIFPLWSSSIFLSTPIGIQSSLVVLQALTMDRHLGPHFKIPAGSILVLILFSASIFLTIMDRFLYPICQKLTRRSPTLLQRIGIGHILNVLSSAVSALVEAKRHKLAHAQNLHGHPASLVPMSALWLFPQLILVGIGEAFHFPGQIALYYQEFPVSLRSTATAVVAMTIGIAYYLSTALIDLVRRFTGWLPDNINNGRVENVYWMLVVVGSINFGYFLICGRLYKYQNAEKATEGIPGSDK